MIQKRKLDHFRTLRKNHHHNFHLQKSYNKHGKEAFEFHILEQCPENMLDIRECHWIAYYKSNQRDFGYNFSEGGEHTTRGYKHTEEFKELQRQRYLGENGPFYGKKHTEEAKEKNRLAHIGKKLSEEHKRKLAEHSKKVGISEETRKKMIESRLKNAKPMSEETRRKISLFQKNRKRTPYSAETREKIRVSKLGDKNPQYGVPRTLESILKQKATVALNKKLKSLVGEQS